MQRVYDDVAKPMRIMILCFSLGTLVSACSESSHSHIHSHPHSHDQGEGHHPDTTHSQSSKITDWTKSMELFIEHPPLIAATEGIFHVHVTRLLDFSPLQNGHLDLSFQPNTGGPRINASQATPSEPGIFQLPVSLPTPGRWNLTLSIETEGKREEIQGLEVLVYGSAREAVEVATASADRDIAFLKEEQWKTPGFRIQETETGVLAGSFEASGQIEAAAGRYAEVTAPIAGVVEAAGVHDAPIPGQWVERGTVLLVLTPSLGESGSTFAKARRELRESQMEFERAQRLIEVEAIPQRRLSEAGIRLDAAREALVELTGGLMLASDGKLVMRSPIDGVVASRTLAAGARVTAGTQIFTLIDPAVVWLRVHVPAMRALQVDTESGASFRLEGHPSVYQATRALSLGSIVEPRSRTVPLLYEVDNPDGSIKVGAHTRVRVRTAKKHHGVVVADSAILEEDGFPIAYVQVSGERFERRELLLGARDDRTAVILQGLAPGERVVTGSAYRVRLASHSSALPSHAH